MLKNLGYYQVDKEIFYQKTKALYSSYTKKTPIKWNFFNDVWESFSENRLDSLECLNLDNLYKLRAEQLRDTYDYLILYYSGGADSHNILMTFLNNNIKLDEIYVIRSQSVDSKIYLPNYLNIKSENIFSEWDYVIKPSLENVQRIDSEIKITINDVFDKDFNTLIDENIFFDTSHFIGPFEILRQTSYPNIILNNLEKNIKTCAIFGIDKPIIVFKNKVGYILFSDTAVSTAYRSNIPNCYKNETVIELFYWTPDMPELAFKQAKTVLDFFKKNDHLQYIMDVNNINTRNTHYLEDVYRKIVIPIIYNTWDSNKFQTNKPLPLNKIGRTRDLPYITNNSFSPIIKKWKNCFSQIEQVINSSFIKETGTLEPIYSSWYHLGSL